MILVVGLKDCQSCVEVKALLEEKNIEFDYQLSNELPKGKWKEYRFSALKKKIETFPIIVLDEKVVTLDELLREVQ